MKKLSVSIILFCLIFAVNSFAQIRSEGTRTEKDSATGTTKTTTFVEVKEEEVITPRHDMITINPLKFITSWNLTYYHGFNSVIAGGIGLQMPTPAHMSGIGVNAEARIYPSRKALRGFYVAPNFSYNHLSYQYDDLYDGFTYKTETYSIGVLLGWQWFPGDDFAIGLGIGIDHYFRSQSGQNFDLIFDAFNGNVPALRFDIGYGW